MQELRDLFKLIRLARRGELPLEVFLRKSESIPGLRIFLLMMRWAILVGIAVRFSVNWHYYRLPDQVWRLGILWPLAFFFLLFTVIVSTLELLNPVVRQSGRYLWTLIALDVFCFSAFYYLTGTEESDFFLFYLLPIFIGIENFNSRNLLVVILIVCGSFAAVLYLISPVVVHPLHRIMLLVFLPRALSLTLVAVLGLFLRQTERVQKRTLMTVLDTMESGVSIVDRDMRLVWVNDYERKIVPHDIQLGVLCHEVFHRRSTPCVGCPVQRALHIGEVALGEVVHEKNRNVRRYELRSAPLRDDRGNAIASLTVVNDVTERARHVDELERREQRLHALQRVSASFRTLEMKTVLEQIVTSVAELGYIAAALAVYDGSRDALVFVAQHMAASPVDWRVKAAISALLHASIGLDHHENAAVKAALEARIVESPNIADFLRPIARPRLADIVQKRSGIKSAAAIPLIVRDELLGSMLVGTENERFTESDLAILKSFAEHASLVLHNAQMYDQMRALREIGIATARQIGSPDSVLRLVLEKASALIGFKVGWISLINERHELQVKCACGVSEDRWFTLRVGEGVTGWVAQTGEPLNVADVAKPISSIAQHARPQYVEFVEETRSELCVPLKSGDEVLGVINIESARPAAFSQQDQELLQALAEQAAIAIGNAGLFEQAKLRFDEIAAILKISLDMAPQLEDALHYEQPTDLLRVIAKRAAESLAATGATFFICDHGEKQLVVRAPYNLDAIDSVRVPFGTGTVGVVAETGIPIIAADYHERKGALSDRDPFSDLFRTAIHVPLSSRGRVIGVLSVCDASKDRKFDLEDIPLLEGYARVAAIAVENTRAFVKLIATMQARIREFFQVLATSQLTLVESDHLSAMARSVMTRAIQGQYDGWSLWLVDSEMESLLLAVSSDPPLGRNRRVTLNLKNSVLGDVVLQGRPQSIRNVQSAPRFQNSEFAAAVGMKSFLAVPVLEGTGIVGAVTVYERRETDFTKDQVATLVGLASQISIAVRHAEVLQQREACTQVLELIRSFYADTLLSCDVPRVLAGIVDAEVCLVYMAECEDRLRLVGSHGLPQDGNSEERVACESAVAYRAFRRKVPLRLNDAPDSRPPVVVAAADGGEPGRGVRAAYAAVPIMHEGKVQGVVAVCHKTKQALFFDWFTAHELDLLDAATFRLAPILISFFRHNANVVTGNSWIE